METKVAVKGFIIFVVTFACFALAKNGRHEVQQEPQFARSTSRQSPAVEQQTTSTLGLETPSQPTPSHPEIETGGLNMAAPAASEGKAPATVIDFPEDIKALLTQWAKAIVANDARLETSYYAENLPNYYGRENVTNSLVEADKQAFIDHGNRVTDLSLQNITLISETPTSASVRLVKDVTWVGQHGTIHKMISSDLTLQMTAQGWEIAGEQDHH